MAPDATTSILTEGDGGELKIGMTHEGVMSQGIQVLGWKQMPGALMRCPLGCDRLRKMGVHKGAPPAHGGLGSRLLLSYDLPISLEQEIDKLDPHTGTQEAELKSGSALICSVTLATFLLHCVPKPSVSGEGSQACKAGSLSQPNVLRPPR